MYVEKVYKWPPAPAHRETKWLAMYKVRLRSTDFEDWGTTTFTFTFHLSDSIVFLDTLLLYILDKKLSALEWDVGDVVLEFYLSTEHLEKVMKSTSLKKTKHWFSRQDITYWNVKEYLRELEKWEIVPK